jgi:hypothetical protein
MPRDGDGAAYHGRAPSFPTGPEIAMRARLLALFLVSALPAAAHARDLYVAPNGDDSASGLAGAPWATLAKAAASVGPGDTVHVAPGDYRESLTTHASGTAGDRIVFVSQTRWGARLDAGGAYTAWLNEGDYVDIVGFDVTGSTTLGIYNRGSYVRVVGNHVHDLPAPNCDQWGGAGIDNGNYSGHDCDTIGNVVHDIGTGSCAGVHGIYHSNLRGRIWNNIAYRNSGFGIHLWHAPVSVVVANNLVFENRSGGIVVGAGDSPGGVTASGMLVSNNIVIHNYGNPGIIESGLTGADNRYENNLVWSNPAGAFRLQNGVTASGTLTADPQLVSYQPDGSGDYHLLQGSPCIDAGTTDGAPADDKDAIARPQGGSIDIGPYEWSAVRCADEDGDGYGSPADGCPHLEADCDDGSASVSPGALEICGNGRDDDCDGAQDEPGCALAGESVFAANPVSGNRGNYLEHDSTRWAVVEQDGDRRYALVANGDFPGDKVYEQAILGGQPIGDFTLRLTARSPEDLAARPWGDFCVVFGRQDADNYYFALFNAYAGASSIERVLGGTSQTIGSASSALITDNGWHSIEVARAGASIVVKCDGAEVMQASDSTFAAGMVGLGSLNDRAQFDDVELIAPGCTDLDGDGFGSPASGCPLALADCDDSSAARYPGAAETCDGLDDDCDGQIDEGLDCGSDAGVPDAGVGEDATVDQDAGAGADAGGDAGAAEQRDAGHDGCGAGSGIVTAGCGCSESGASPALTLIAPIALLLLRRKQSGSLDA